MNPTQIRISIAVPPNIDEELFRSVVSGFYQFQFFHVSDFWEGYAELLYAAYRVGDRELLAKISSNSLAFQDIPGMSQDQEVDYLPTENQSTIVKDAENQFTKYDQIPVVIHSEVCEFQQDIWMNVPCSMTSCQHFCDKPEFFNCGYSAADIENPSEYSIAYQLGVDVAEVETILEQGLDKLRKSILKEEYLAADYDVLDIEGFCQCCNKPQDTIQEYLNGSYCPDCISDYSELGCDLVKRHAIPLKKLLENTFRYHKNLNYQAFSLKVQPKELTDLYYRVGIIKQTSSVKPATFLTNKRPGRAIKIENTEYFNLNVLATLSYQKPTPSVLERLEGLSNRVNMFVEMDSIAGFCQ